MPKLEQIFQEGDSRRLNEHEVIWRYVPLRTLFFHLNGLVFIPSVEKLSVGDPFEGKFYEHITWFNHAFGKHYGKEALAIEEWMEKELFSVYDKNLIELNRGNLDAANAISKIFEKHYFNYVRRTRFAWCWFRSPHESAAMWNIYGKQGVAIKTTVGKLSSLLEKVERDFIYGSMTYVKYQNNSISTEFDPSEESNFSLLLRPFFLKRKEYESEHEVRFVTVGNDCGERGGILLNDLEPQDWISAVQLWPSLKPAEEDSILKIVSHFAPKIDCQKSDLLSDRELSGLDKIMSSDLARAEHSNWIEGLDGIPARLKTL